MLAQWHIMHPRATLDHIGLLIYWLSNDNPAPAKEQLHKNYMHGGGWHPFHGFTLGAKNELIYPGDPPQFPIAQARLRDELVLVYEHAWVAIVQPDRSFEVARMD